MATIDQLLEIRRKKLETLRKRGIDSYPARCRREQTIDEAREMEGKPVAVVGRLMSLRGHGKIIFADLRDESGKIQIAFKADLLKNKTFSLLSLIDISDFLSVQGKVGRTQAGEISVFADDFQIITKSLRPLPDKWYGFKDVEERYRKRYLDLIINQDSKKIFEVRSRLVQGMREFLLKRDYYEVETPILQPLYGGGLARPFKTYHNVLGMPLYLRISTELYLKRLIVGGFEKVFEIAKVFRNEGIDKDHNPEFTILETMEAYIDYKENMKLVEEMTQYAVKKAIGGTKVVYDEKEIDFRTPWKRMTMVEAVKQETGIDFPKIKSLKEAQKVAQDLKVELDQYLASATGSILAAIFEEKVEKNLIQPTIIHDFPVETSPLAKKCPDDPQFVERWEHFAAGMELSNNYSELNDPSELGERFQDERKRERLGDEEAHQTDEDFIEAMEYGMPPTSGIGPGIDRLTLILCQQFGARNLRDVLLFPTMRPGKGYVDNGVRGDKATRMRVQSEVEVESPIPKDLGITRERAISLLKKYLKDEEELKHLYASEAAMRFYAKKFGGHEEAWGLTGLLHDIDWDLVKGDMNKHGQVGAGILEKEGICQPIVYAVLAHNENLSFERKTLMDRVLLASEELTGLILATAKVMPDRSLYSVATKSVLKKIKNPQFAATVNRENIVRGAEEIGLSLEEHVENVLNAMKSVSDVLGFGPKKDKQMNGSPVEISDWTNKDIFYIDSEVMKKLPNMKIGVALIKRVNIERENKELEELKKEIIGKFKGLSTEKIGKFSTIIAYRDLFKKFGVDWHSHRPSPDALLRRIALGKGLYKVNTLVDAYNLAVLETKIGLGAFDADKLSMPVVLRFAKEGETIVLLGEDGVTAINEGELIYADQKRVITLDLNYRDCDYTKITPETTDVLLFADGCEGISLEELTLGLERGTDLITRFCGGTVEFKGIVQ